MFHDIFKVIRRLDVKVWKFVFKEDFITKTRWWFFFPKDQKSNLRIMCLAFFYHYAQVFLNKYLCFILSLTFDGIEMIPNYNRFFFSFQIKTKLIILIYVRSTFRFFFGTERFIKKIQRFRYCVYKLYSTTIGSVNFFFNFRNY